MKTWSWLILILSVLLIKLASTQPLWVEENFSGNIYPVVSRVQRALTGWVPFSIGDLLYLFLGLIIIFKSIMFFRAVFRKQINRQYLLTSLRQLIFFFLLVYVLFYGLWGLNYNRKGIAYQLNLEIKSYTVAELDTLTSLIHQRLNSYAEKVNLDQRDSVNRKKTLFERATEAYLFAASEHPFLEYNPQSLKPSVFSYLGNYLGFQGYYNPISGEGQVNTTIPKVIEPFVSTHEIAHQLGYAKENEANFVGFLACRHYPSDVFRYSMYFDLFNYAMFDMEKQDSLKAKSYLASLHPQVKQDLTDYYEFFRKYSNPVEPVITWLYGQYLQANNQPEGKKTYNQVIAYLIAYYKKYGKDAI